MNYSIPDIEGVEMPKPDEILSSKQRDGSNLNADKIYAAIYKLLDIKGVIQYVPTRLIEQYSMCYARWLQCERMTNELGFISRHPTTNKPVASPFVTIGIEYMNQANKIWESIIKCIPNRIGIGLADDNYKAQIQDIINKKG